jgi:hypothetical protein
MRYKNYFKALYLTATAKLDRVYSVDFMLSSDYYLKDILWTIKA